MGLASTIMNVQFEATVRFVPLVERADADEVKTIQALIGTTDTRFSQRRLVEELRANSVDRYLGIS
jgi:hypothetical protein